MPPGIKIRPLAKNVDRPQPRGREEAARLYEQDVLELADRAMMWPSRANTGA